MQKMFLRAMAACLSLLSVAASAASDLQTYVQQCQSELHFNASDVPAMDCNNGVRFAGGNTGRGSGIINDYLLYKRVNDTVDLAVACRWLDNSSGVSTKAGSVEMLIHNRQNGSTCFFSAKDSGSDAQHPVSTSIISPTNFGARPNADDFWVPPSDLNTRRLPSDQNDFSNVINVDTGFPDAGSYTDPIRCVGCHTQGAYIASKDIAPFLAQFGLLNNRHDTVANMTAANHYHAVGSNVYTDPFTDPPTGTKAFKGWDTAIYGNNYYGSDCSTNCHTVARYAYEGTLYTVAGGRDRLLPSISSDIHGATGSAMPPYNDDASDYRWINLDTAGDGVEAESFADAKNPNTPPPVPQLLQYGCVDKVSNTPGVPSVMEAHAVGSVQRSVGNAPDAIVPGSENIFSTSAFSSIPDRLKYFNLKDGLTCLNSDQDPGYSCHNYAIRYLCSNGLFTGWYQASLSSDGDHQERSHHSGICTSAPNLTAVGIQAQFSVNGTTYTVTGPSDRLARFSPFGLTCNLLDQPDGKCSNYVVRYRQCVAPVSPYSRALTNVFTAKQLTAASGSLVKGQAHNGSWNTQQWTIEPVPNTEYVRVHNASAYLSVASAGEQAVVGTATLNTTAMGEMWTIESVNGASDYRLKNLLSGRYLTMADPKNVPSTPDYLPIYSQALNTGWTSQRWLLQ